MEALPLIATAIGLFLSMSATPLGGVKWMLGRVEQRTDARFSRVDARFDRMDARFDRMEAHTVDRFATVGDSLMEVKLGLARLETRTDERFSAVGHSLGEVKVALARLEGPHPPFLIARG